MDLRPTEFRGRITAGLLDAGVSSLSGFVIGLSATLLLDPALLGIYAVFFSAYGLAMVFPAEFAFAPAEIIAVRLPESDRPGILKGSLRSGGVVALATSGLTMLSIPLATSIASTRQIAMLTGAAILASFFGPLEEHVRRVLHLAGRSWAALTASSVMLITSIVFVLVLNRTSIDPAGIPMTALAVSNAASFLTSVILARPKSWSIDPALTKLRSLFPVGRWLVFTGALPAGAEFIISALVTTLAGAVYLGYAEAARVVAQPVLVLGIGLLRVLGPQSIRAGQSHLPELGRKMRRMFLLIIGPAALIYAIAAGWDWSLNPFARLVPAAYAVPGLVLITVAANALGGVGFADRSELLGGRKEKRIAKSEVGAVVVSLAVASSAAYSRAFARPLARLGGATFRVVAYRLYLKSFHREAHQTITDAPPSAGTTPR